MQIQVETLTSEAFEPFGTVLGEPARPATISDSISNAWLGFSDLMSIGSGPGHPVTYLQIHSRPERFDVLEKHVTSAEAFIPLEGLSILMVAPAGTDQPDLHRAKAFLMDGSQGVLMPKGTWHAVPYLLSDRASYLVLVDDQILAKGDIVKSGIEEVAFDLSGLPASVCATERRLRVGARRG